MGNDEVELKAITLRVSVEDYAALEAEAKQKKRALATYCRELLHAHLAKADFSDQVKSEVMSIMTSEEFDDVIVQKFLRAMEKRR